MERSPSVPLPAARSEMPRNENPGQQPSSSTSARTAYVVRLGSGVYGKVFALEEMPAIMGRARECDLVVDDSTVSRQHARLTWVAPDQGWLLEDLDSANGTTVDGVPIQQRLLKGGETIHLGDAGVLFSGGERPGSGRRVALLILLIAVLGTAIALVLYNLIRVAGDLPV